MRFTDEPKSPEQAKLQAALKEAHDRVAKQREEIQKAQQKLDRDLQECVALARKLEAAQAGDERINAYRVRRAVPVPPIVPRVVFPITDQEKRLAEVEKKLERLIDVLAKQKDVGDLPPMKEPKRAR